MLMIYINNIYNIDVIEGLKKLDDNSVDLVVTSPPYWKGFEYEAYFNSYRQYMDWSKEWMREVKRVLKPNGTFYLNVINDSEITIRAYEMLSIATELLMFKLHDTIIWYRYNQQPANTNRQLTNQQEFVFMLRHSSANVELNKDEVKKNFPHVFKTKNVSNVWEIPFNSQRQGSFGRKETKSKWGHSGFPVELPSICINLSTKENDIVLDPFIGTGTTAIACIDLKRNFIGFDLNKEACEISLQRIKMHTKQIELKV